MCFGSTGAVLGETVNITSIAIWTSYDYAEFSPTARARRPIASNYKRVKNGEIWGSDSHVAEEAGLSWMWRVVGRVQFV